VCVRAAITFGSLHSLTHSTRAAKAVVQSSQMYDVTVVGLEVQIPRTNSYILHPCDLRASITHRLPAKVWSGHPFS
jgi:hypothetical protein